MSNLKNFSIKLIFVASFLIIASNAIATPPVIELGKDLGGAPLPEPWISDKPVFENFPSHRILADHNLACCGGAEIEDECFATYFNWIASGHTFVLFGAELNRLNSALGSAQSELATLKEQCTQELRRYIYKPVSENDGNVVVLTEPKAEVTIVGDISETLDDRGPSNGFDSTLRSRNRCVAFGNDVRLEIEINGLPAKSIFIRDGCIRQEKR